MRKKFRPDKYTVCEGYDWHTKRRRKYVRHNYTLQIDSDGNYRCCVRCHKVSLRLAAGERDSPRAYTVADESCAAGQPEEKK